MAINAARGSVGKRLQRVERREDRDVDAVLAARYTALLDGDTTMIRDFLILTHCATMASAGPGA